MVRIFYHRFYIQDDFFLIILLILSQEKILMEPRKVFLLTQSEVSNLVLLPVQEQVNTLFNQF